MAKPIPNKALISNCNCWLARTPPKIPGDAVTIPKALCDRFGKMIKQIF